MTTEEAELWRRKAAGDPKAREALILRYRGDVAAIRGKEFPIGPEVSPTDAEDLEMAGLNGLIHAIDRFEAGRGGWRFYMYRCVTGFMRDQYARLRGLSGQQCQGKKRTAARAIIRVESLNSEERPDCLPDPTSGDAAARLLNANELRAALASLPEPQARLLWLHDAEGMSLAATAREIGLPQATIGPAYRAAKEAAKAAIHAAGYLESVERREKSLIVSTNKRRRSRGRRFPLKWQLRLDHPTREAMLQLSQRFGCSDAEVVRRLVAEAAGAAR